MRSRVALGFRVPIEKASPLGAIQLAPRLACGDVEERARQGGDPDAVQGPDVEIAYRREEGEFGMSDRVDAAMDPT